MVKIAILILSTFLGTSMGFAGTVSVGSPTVPLEFPQVDQNYTFIDNSSIRDDLARKTEIEDLLGRDVTSGPKDTNVTTQIGRDVTSEPQDTNVTSQTGPELPETEWIEDGDDTEDDKFETSTNADVTDNTEDDNDKFKTSQSAGIPLLDGTLAAILVGVFLVLSIVGYVALLLWRRSLELKYGSREILVDKDEMYDPDDMKHFSVSIIMTLNVCSIIRYEFNHRTLSELQKKNFFQTNM